MPRIATRPAGSRSAVTAALSADVVVVGGGPAATCAALGAAESGVDVVPADKSSWPTRGAAAPADQPPPAAPGSGTSNRPARTSARSTRPPIPGLDEVRVEAGPVSHATGPSARSRSDKGRQRLKVAREANQEAS
jgi:glycine/D-amino acid oxidase-like deaminating enzyme